MRRLKMLILQMKRIKFSKSSLELTNLVKSLENLTKLQLNCRCESVKAYQASQNPKAKEKDYNSIICRNQRHKEGRKKVRSSQVWSQTLFGNTILRAITTKQMMVQTEARNSTTRIREHSSCIGNTSQKLQKRREIKTRKLHLLKLSNKSKKRRLPSVARKTEKLTWIKSKDVRRNFEGSSRGCRWRVCLTRMTMRWRSWKYVMENHGLSHLSRPAKTVSPLALIFLAPTQQ